MCSQEERRYGVMHRITYSTYSKYGGVLQKGKKWKEAQQMWEGMIRRRKIKVGTDPSFILEAMVEVCRCLKKQGKEEELKE